MRDAISQLANEAGQAIGINDFFAKVTEFDNGDFQPGGAWVTAGVDDIFDEETRAMVGSLVENGFVPLYTDVQSPLGRLLPLTIADFTLIRKGDRAAVVIAPETWKRACSVLAFHAAVAGISLGEEMGAEVKRQCERLRNMPLS